MSSLGKVYDNFLARLQPPKVELKQQYLRLLSDCDTLYDVGCGAGNHLENISFRSKGTWIGIDSHQASLDLASKKEIYSQVVCADILEFLTNCPDSSVDTVLASCVIEHMPIEIGLRLLEEMKRVCRISAVIFTPNGFVAQPPDVDNAANEHVSGWSPKVLSTNGFLIDSGLYGFKKLRSSFGLPTIKPMMLGDLVAKSTSRLAFRFPSLAYQVVAVYKK
jgi:ubiquinone/menaquinone biosynthesis C-methylase UbiE